MNDLWTKQYRDLLDNILDLLIPANSEKGIPSAGVAGVSQFIALRAAHDELVFTAVNTLLTDAASMVGEVSVQSVQQLEANYAKQFSVLVTLVYMGYYSQPELRSVVGVASWPVHPKGYEVPLESSQLMQQLTAPVTERGPQYRDPNDPKQAPPR